MGVWASFCDSKNAAWIIACKASSVILTLFPVAWKIGGECEEEEAPGVEGMERIEAIKEGRSKSWAGEGG